MKHVVWLVIFCSVVGFAQTRQQIDSLNNIAFEIRFAKAAVLDAAYHKNVKAAQKLHYAQGEAMSYSNLALVYNFKGKYNLSVEYSLKAIKLFERIGDESKVAREYGELGYAMKRRNLPKAQYYMLRGKKLAETIRDTTSLLSIYNNYGVIKEMQQDLDSAMFFYRKGLVIKEAINDSTGIPYSLNNIAIVHAMEGRFHDAEQLFTRALQLRQRKKDSAGIAENYSYFGDLYGMKKEYRKAIGNFRLSNEIALRNKYFQLIQHNYQSMSEMHEALGEKDLAFAAYKKHVQFKESLINKETNAKIAELEVQFETNEKEKRLIETQSESARKSNLLLLLSVLTFFVSLTGFLIWRQQRLKNNQLAQEHELKSAIAQIETQNKLQEQRLGISRDLHDNIGSQLTFIISSVDNLKYAFDLKNTALDRKLENISDFTKDTILELRDTIWAMNSDEITFEDVLSRISNFIEKARGAKESMRFNVSIDDDLAQFKLSSVTGMNVYRTVQEAVNNAVKYSQAEAISISVKKQLDFIEISISDNGSGFDVETVQKGNGLGNMAKRMQDAQGNLELTSDIGKGTIVTLKLPFSS
ncbi:MAG: tetratricopeptide repeat protein [Flavobacterium sp.]|uniref:tetratricopeptide repeat-containing sensor histidine kinase n=1 Tax=Flavobacterium sp. TaxID=239 RepID=UPI00121F351B|nr:tetratricopeptide repeat protein [Flavobacterium sp.]RZJ66365.1 MAG: tetratricopeptide repeat protein [Flavobacterium sp.]